MPLSGYRSGIFLTLSVLWTRDLPSGAMSEGVDLIDIYADEEFNQVRGHREHWDFPGSAEESLSPNLQWFQAIAVLARPEHPSIGSKILLYHRLSRRLIIPLYVNFKFPRLNFTSLKSK